MSSESQKNQAITEVRELTEQVKEQILLQAKQLRRQHRIIRLVAAIGMLLSVCLIVATRLSL